MKFRALFLAAFTVCVLPAVHASSISSEDFDKSNAAFHTIGNGLAAPCGSLESDHCVDLGMDATDGTGSNAMTTVAMAPAEDPMPPDNDPTFSGGDTHNPNDSDPPVSAADPTPEPSTFALAGLTLLGLGALLRRARRV